jgi:hypothetical protein
MQEQECRQKQRENQYKSPQKCFPGSFSQDSLLSNKEIFTGCEKGKLLREDYLNVVRFLDPIPILKSRKVRRNFFLDISNPFSIRQNPLPQITQRIYLFFSLFVKDFFGKKIALDKL